MKYLILVLLMCVVGCNKKVLVDDIQESIDNGLTLHDFADAVDTPVAVVEIVEPEKEVQEAVIKEERFIETLYFEFDSDVLTVPAVMVLEGVVNTILGQDGYSIHVEGFACPIGGSDYNYLLGDRRAQSVYNYLKKHLICTMSFNSSGEDNLRTSEPSQYHQNRRAELEITRWQQRQEEERELLQ